MPRLVDTAAAQLATGVPAATIRHWLRRGKLTRHGHDYHGRAIVDLDEVQQRAAQLAAYQAKTPGWDRAACGSRAGVSH
jgi:hypothetical protein